MNVMKSGFLCVVCLAVGAVFAEDLTVAVGESVTISADATYANVTVNGALVVADGVKLTATTSLTVADGIDGTATFELGEGATVEVTSAGGTKFGVGAGRAEVTLGKNATFRGQGYVYVCYGYSDDPGDANAKATEASVVLNEGALLHTGTDVYFGGGQKPSGTDASAVKAVIRLNKGSEISTQRITDSSYTSEIIEFNGGQICQRTGGTYTTGFIQMPYAARSSYLYLDSIDAKPISFYLPGGGKYSAFASFGSKACRLVARGDGAFSKSGVGEFPIVSNDTNYNNSPTDPNFKLLNAGGLQIGAGGFKLTSTNVLQGARNTVSRDVDVVVASGACLDLGGVETAVVGSIKGPGLLKNTGSIATKFTIGVNNADSKLPKIEGDINVIKKGTGKLSLCANTLSSLDVQTGEIELLSRQFMGYPFYRFQVDAYKAGLNSNVQMRMNDIAFLCDGQDVTRPYAKLYHTKAGSSYVGEPEYWVDGDLATQYYDLRAQNLGGDSDEQRVGVTLEYADVKPVDALCWAPALNASRDVDPTAWRVLGGFATDNLVVLSQVTGFEVSADGVRDGWLTTNFVCRAPESSALQIGTLKIASGVKISMKGAAVTCETLTSSATGLELNLCADASLPLTAAQTVSKITVDCAKEAATVGVLNPEATGAIYLTGDKRQVKGDLLRAQSCENAANFKNWSVYVNGVLDNRRVCFENGALKLPPYGIVLVVR